MYCVNATCAVCVSLRGAPEAARVAVLRGVAAESAKRHLILDYVASHSNGDARVGGIRELQLELYGVLKSCAERAANCKVYGAYHVGYLGAMEDYFASAPEGLRGKVHVPPTDENAGYSGPGWEPENHHFVRQHQYISPEGTAWSYFGVGGLMDAFGELYVIDDRIMYGGGHLCGNLSGTYRLRLYKFPGDVCVLYIRSDTESG